MNGLDLHMDQLLQILILALHQLIGEHLDKLEFYRPRMGLRCLWGIAAGYQWHTYLLILQRYEYIGRLS